VRPRRRRRLAEGIVSDTAIGFGAATIEGTGLRVDVIAGRHRAGETSQAIADDYGISQRLIWLALEYSHRRSECARAKGKRRR